MTGNGALRIGIAGLGTVGAGLVRLLAANRTLLESRAGRSIAITAVSARDPAKDRGIDLSDIAFVSDMAGLAGRDDVDVVVELVGGSEGPALDLARAALSNGKGFVTANKAMIAIHGAELAALAQEHGAPLAFEAAVAGGIPVLKGLREGAAANRLERIYGILNGTCNYILSTMERDGSDFAEVLGEAQRLGYAEADPTFDIEGVDAAHKLAILAAIGFGTQLDFPAVRCDGIARIRAADIARAEALGYRIRLVGMADAAAGEDGAVQLFQRVQPFLVPRSHPLAHVDGPTNAVVAEGDFAGRLMFQGAGAGGGPTASAVTADILDIARGLAPQPFSVPVEALVAATPVDPGARQGRNYVRFTVADRPGVLAAITAAMRDAGVSIESLIQLGEPGEGGDVLVALVTHQGPQSALDAALGLLEGSDDHTGEPLVLRILSE